MKRNNSLKNSLASRRNNPRAFCLREICITYEGQNEETFVKTPDLSARGMFVSTNRRFPEGAVLNLRFRLATTNVEVQTRGEVRYCLAGVGVGVEFIGITTDAAAAIEKELSFNTSNGSTLKQRRPRRTARKLR